MEEHKTAGQRLKEHLDTHGKEYYKQVVMNNAIRTPIKVKRKAITVASKYGYSLGGWFAFPKPDEEPPSFGRLRNSQRVLWCPYCNDWSVFQKGLSKYTDHYTCTGVCGWANTGDFHVRTVNKIWFEDVPLAELKKMDIPRPSKGRR